MISAMLMSVWQWSTSIFKRRRTRQTTTEEVHDIWEHHPHNQQEAIATVTGKHWGMIPNS